MEPALKDSEEAIKIDPKSIDAMLSKAHVLRSMDRMEEAIKIISELDPKEENKDAKTLKEECVKELQIDHVLKEDCPEMQRMNKFLKWLSDGGSIFNKIKMRFYTADYRGVHAKTKIQKNEVFLVVPQSQILTLDMAKESPIGAKMVKAGLHLLSPKHSFLSTLVMQERRKPDTKWAPYLDILPKSFGNFPIFFTKEEKKWLEGSPFLNQVEDKILDVAKDYKTISTAVPEYTQFSLEEYSQVRMLISSRIFGISIKGHKTDGLVPLADMLNHKRPRQTAWEFSDKRDAFIIESKEAIERGDQVYDSYGKKCNSRFFLNYGFIVENNDANEVPIKLQLDMSDPLYDVKVKILGSPSVKTIRVSEDLTEKNMRDFFSYLRFLEFRGDPMILYKFQFKYNSQAKQNEDDEDEDLSYQGTNLPPVSVENEKSVLDKIRKMADIQYRAYPTTYEADLKILEKPESLTFNQRNAVLMRSGEKKVLLYLLELCNLGLEYIDMPLKKAREAFGKRKDGDKFSKYFLESLFPLMLTEEGKKKN